VHRNFGRGFHERAALDLLGRDGVAIVWQLHVAAAEAFRAGYPRGAQILIETADAAERLLRHSAGQLGFKSRRLDRGSPKNRPSSCGSLTPAYAIHNRSHTA
jgi:hypothetical protein